MEMALWKIIPPEEGSDFVTDLFIMEETCVLPGRNPIVINAVWKISARKYLTRKEKRNMALKAVHHIALLVSDYQKSKSFMWISLDFVL